MASPTSHHGFHCHDMIRILVFLLSLSGILPGKESVSLDRIVVIGASVSRGFTESEPFGGEKSMKLSLDRYLDTALTASHGKIINDANLLFFMSAEKQARTQLERLARREPTLVVAVDFLFWFLYGQPSRTGDRLEAFDRGLELLSGIDVPLVVGDIPDASAAVGHMLSSSMVPDRRTRQEANRRLAAWAAGRPRVSIVPLSKFVESSESDSALRAGPLVLEPGSTRLLLQPDRLHPSPDGCAALALAVMESLLDDGLRQDEILWDLEKMVSLSQGHPE